MTTNEDRPELESIQFIRNIHGREFLEITHPAVTARIALEGAHIVSCVPTGQQPLLWMSPSDPEVPGRPLRGGIPICWPWFAGERDGPAHGIARTSPWILKRTVSTQHQLRVVLELPQTEVTRRLPAESWSLEVEFVLGQSLIVCLTTVNTGDKPQVLSQALHSYLPVKDISDVQLWGLEGSSFVDQVTGIPDNTQQGAVTFEGEVDRIYYDHQSSIQLHDSSGNFIVIARDGSESVVVWNPWIDKSKTLSQFPADGYRTMVCVEAANAGPDARILEPGERHTLSTEIKRA
ncbi:MAG TPA: D-hexose-6-phosphate mutarotase [Pseudomonas xinjiangensis]|uniref:glucose-6-phosphate 1-epimerase n=2 Tax=root TaxID=1 RepID=A0A0F9V0K8_9ZZZZ|nr:D-hexose-6-phosphate mutarotase [Halopseudomonas xinjiangensis]HEC48186.1 D-hexose-6-phosphate mutarotase [Halopseudomonas xinjiangensis]